MINIHAGKFVILTISYKFPQTFVSFPKTPMDFSRVWNIHIDEPLNYNYIAQKQIKYASKKLISKYTSVTLTEYPVRVSDKKILCENSKNHPRPYVPPSCRKRIFNHFHSISHPGKRTSQKLISDRFFLPSVNTNILTWTQHCIPCQKTDTDTQKEIMVYFQLSMVLHVHIDIVGPLPTSNENLYILTMINKFIRWPSAHAIKDISAQNIGKIFIERWISNFGISNTITTDRDQQFQSAHL